MTNKLVKRTQYDWPRHHNIFQFVNLSLGMILVITTLVFLMIRSSDSQMNTYMLGLCGVLALWAGLTDNERRIYVIDMLLGLLFISSSAGTAIFNDVAIRAEVIIRTLTGLIFLIIAYRFKNLWKRSKIKKKELIEDFEP